MIDEFVEKLKQAEQPRSDFVNFMENIHDPYIVLIACILSLRTNDKTTYPATLRMLQLGRTPEDFAKCDVKILEKAIYPVGFYANKARQIVELSRTLVEKYNSKVPDSLEEMTKCKSCYGKRISKTRNLRRRTRTQNFQPPRLYKN